MSKNKKEIKITLVEDGFVEPVLKPEDYISDTERSISKLGFADEILRPDGQWDDFLPEEETQIKATDTANCTAFGATSSAEIVIKNKFGELNNYSDRFLGIRAGTRPPGNDPQVVFETLRKTGAIPEELLPFSEELKNAEEYYSFKGADEELCGKAAKEWLSKYKLKHEWLPLNPTPEQIKEALKRSPLAVAVYAWAEQNGKYIRLGSDTHLTILYGFYENGDFKCWDSYAPFKKRLDKNFGFKWVKKIHIEPALTPQEKNIFSQILDALAKILTLQFLWLEKKKEIEVIPDEVIPDKVEPEPEPKYKWGNREEVRHSVRVICDEYGLAMAQKGLLVAVLEAESGLDPRCVGKPNKNGTRDWGLAQFNDGKNKVGQAYWIGKGADFADTEEVLNDPEKCVRVMIREYKAGHIGYWSAFKNGSYKKYL